MLSELIVHNFAIIRHLEISFQRGMNVLSGETGAGKSILVGAVNLILGSRASQEMIRTGANEASVEAVFHLPTGESPIKERLKEWGMAGSEDIVIRRSINRGGRNRVFINDQIAVLQQLQQIARALVSISGQHENQLLMDPDVHLGLLDSFGGLESLRREVGRVYAAWSAAQERLNKLRRFKQEQAAQLDFMRFQLQELTAAQLQPEEDKLLDQERNMLRHAATLLEAAQGAHTKLYAGRGAVLEQLADVSRNVEALIRIDPTQQPLSNHLEQARIQIEELAYCLQQYAHRICFDPGRLADVEERLSLLQRLGKKYGGSVESMLRRLAVLQETVEQEGDSDLRETEALKELEHLRREYLGKATDLSERRREAAGHLSREVQDALAALDMSRARFAVAMERLGDPGDGTAPSSDPPFTQTGIDRAEFLLSANPGEDLKPLVRIASGGELSRILLALKSLLSREGEAETLIFDEVDAGIGGRTAELVGLQLKKLAGRHQVICITHLPQIACYGEHHYKVAKETNGEQTITHINLLSKTERVDELARMLGGISISQKTRAHARELLERTQQGD